MGLFFFVSFIPLLVLGALAVGIIALIRRAGGDEDPGIGTVRRLFYYGVSFVALMLAASGLQALLSATIDAISSDVIARELSGGIAFGVAAFVVGGPVWLAFWLLAQRSVRKFPTEAGSVGRKVYMYGVLTVAAATAAGTLTALLIDLFASGSFAGGLFAGAIVWLGVWVFHWVAETQEGQPTGSSRTLRRLHVYSASVYGVALLLAGTGTLLATLLGATYDALFTEALVGRSGFAFNEGLLRSGVAMTMVGAAWWAWYWHRSARADEDSMARQWVLYGFGVFGGTAISIAFAAALVEQALAWALAADRGSAALAFDVVPGALAGVIAGGGLLGYHAASAQQEAKGDRAQRGQRTSRYLLAGTGLGTLTVGLVLLFGVIIGILIPGAAPLVAGSRWWSDPLAFGLTTTLVGAPLWLYHWSRQQSALPGDPSEREALPRQVYIYGVFGIAVLSATGALIAVIVSVVSASLDGNLGGGVLGDTKWALGVLLTTALVGAYHGLVLREDQALVPTLTAAPIVVAKRVTLLAHGDAHALAKAIEASAAGTVITWRRLDIEVAPANADIDLDALATRIQEAPVDRLLVIVHVDGVDVIPYEDA